MTKLKHTPGPWKQSRFSPPSTLISIIGPPALHLPYGQPICSVRSGHGQPLLENAKLIEAAPELLEACQGLLTVLEATLLVLTREDGENSCPEVTQARAAIARATQGETDQNE